jgi:Sec-independent protein translocase protein TatA
VNFFGIGPLELIVILMVAFIALGPGKTMEVARTLGRVVREARRTFTDVMDAASVTEDDLRWNDTDSNPASNPPVRPPSDPLTTPPHLQSRDDTPAAEAAENDNDRPAPQL